MKSRTNVSTLEYKVFTMETVFDFICVYKAQHNGNSPTIRDVAREFGKSTSVADAMLDRLASRGLIERCEDGAARKIIVAGSEWRMKDDHAS